jgi:small subunit ribosomal protein S7e
MAANWRKKVLKADPDAVDQSVAQALHDLEKSVDPQHRAEIRELTIHSASEVDVGAGKKAVLVVVPYSQLNTFRRLHHILATNMEKKFRSIIWCQSW